MGRGKCKCKSEMRGSLHCAMDDETVHRFGRDVASLVGLEEGPVTASATAGPDLPTDFDQEDNSVGVGGG